MLEELLDTETNKKIENFITDSLTKKILTDTINKMAFCFVDRYGLWPNTIYLGKKEIDVFDYLISNEETFRLQLDNNNKFRPQRRFQDCKLIEVAEISHISVGISNILEDSQKES